MCTFRATDLDIEVIDRRRRWSPAGATTVPAHTLHEIARKLPDGAMVELGDDGIGAARRARRPLALQPRDAAARGLPGHGARASAETVPAPAGVLRRLFDKAKFAISTEETRYYLNGVYMHAASAATGRCCAAWRPTATAWRNGDAALPGGRGAARGHRAAQDRGRAPQAARRRRGDDRGLGQRDQGPLRLAGVVADLEADRRHLPRLRARHPDRQRQAARGRCRRVRPGRRPGGDHLVRDGRAP